MSRQIVPKTHRPSTPLAPSPPPKALPPAQTPSQRELDPRPVSLHTQAIIDNRHAQIQNLTSDYIMDLARATGDLEDLGITAEDLDDLIDEFEAILASRGILIYHPALFTDPLTGQTYVVDSSYD